MLLIGLSGKAGSGKDTVADYLVRTYGMLKLSFADPLRSEVQKAFNLTPERMKELCSRELKEEPAAELALVKCDDPKFCSRLIDLNITPLDFKVSVSPRRILQWWGTDYRRKDDPDYWVAKAGAFLSAFISTKKRKVADLAEAERVAEDFGLKPTTTGKGKRTRTIKASVPLGTEYYEDHPGLVFSDVRFENEANFIRDSGTVWRIDRPKNTLKESAAGHSSETLPLLRTGDKLLINDGTIEQLNTGSTMMLSGELGIVNTNQTD